VITCKRIFKIAVNIEIEYQFLDAGFVIALTCVNRLMSTSYHATVTSTQDASWTRSKLHVFTHIPHLVQISPKEIARNRVE
jgi:hypothetical protein